ncbi:MAG: GTP-binding protein [Gammaproteobacteria bacterium]|nr:GTP-binding protein [Gammaproteobacteria bacterium]
MVGDFAVGKTSLTQKFVNNVFSDKYLTTVGVKIDTADVSDTKLVVWDVAGRDALSPINAAYLAGAAGIVLVGDGTRPETIKSFAEIWQTVSGKLGDVPVVVALNKRDVDGWEVTDDLLQTSIQSSWAVFETSAKDGSNVPELFAALVDRINC